jgi:tetratricopeptide (TPR) repeat protein
MTAEGYPGEDVTWNSQVLLARAARLRGAGPRALQVLNTLQQAQPPAAVMDAVMAERSRVLLNQKKFSEAYQQLQEYLKMRRPLPGELGVLGMQLLIEQWQAAHQQKATNLTTESQSAIESQIQQLRREVGGYWAYRGELLLEQAYESRELGPELAASIRAARTLFHNGRVPQSIETYARAARAAMQADKPDLAFNLAYTRGSIQLEAQDYQEAATSFQELVRQFPENSRTADADLLAAHALGKLYEQNPTKTRRVDYTAALEAHRARYTGQPTAAEAAWMEAQFEERRQQDSSAVKLYATIPAAHPRHAAAQVAIARCYEKILDRVHAAQQPAAAWEAEAVSQLQALLPEFQLDRKLNSEQAEIALRLARILLHRQPPDFTGAERWLGWIFDSAPPLAKQPAVPPEPAVVPADAWKTLHASAMKWRVVSLAGQGKHAEAEALLNQLTQSSPAELLPILDGLTQLVTESPAKTQRSLGELQLNTALRLGKVRDRLSPAEQRRLDLCLAQAYVATQQNERAIQIYETLLKGAPRDRALLTSFGTLLLKCGTPLCREKGLAIWRKLEAEHPAGTLPWLEARLQVAQCLLELGQYDQCLKLIGVTRLLYPKLLDTAHQERLAKLEAECRQRRKP